MPSMWGTPPSLPGQLMPSAAGPQGPSSLIHTTILISVFSSYGEKKKSICAAWLPALIARDRPLVCPFAHCPQTRL